MSEPGNGVEYRFRKIEDAIATIQKRLDSLDEHGSRRVGVIETELKNLRDDVADLNGSIRELRQDMRDTRHRLGAVESATSMLGGQVGTNSQEVTGLRRALIGSALGVTTAVIVSSITLWLVGGGSP